MRDLGMSIEVSGSIRVSVTRNLFSREATSRQLATREADLVSAHGMYGGFMWFAIIFK